MVLETLVPESKDLFWEISEVAKHYHVSCVERSRDVRGGGFHFDRTEAKKRAFVELNERHLVKQIVAGQVPGWGVDFDWSGSGFAAGYDERSTKRRALLEAVERWALARWIDQRCEIPRAPKVPSSDLNAFYLDHSLYLLTIPLLVEREILNVHVAVFLGWSERGVFAGYGTKSTASEAVEHAQVEAYRNFVIDKNQPPRDYFPYDRIRYFAENKEVAIAALDGMKKDAWRPPALKIWKVERIGDIYLARAIMDGWKPWQLGSVSRFLY